MSVAGFRKGIKDITALQKAMGIYEYEDFAKEIIRLVKEGKLQPTKKGKETNGKYPPLSKKYRIIEDNQLSKAEEVDLKNEIVRSFPLKYSKSYYLGHIKHYINDRELLLNLCEYHKKIEKPLTDCMSVNERLFDIFSHEKNISLNEVIRVLRNIELDESYLNIYETPEPFIFHSSNDKLEQRILIIENKDTWYTLRKLKQEGIGSFDSIIYGEGKKILKSFDEIGQHQKPWFNEPSNRYYYFGDMDDEGSWIFQRLQSIALTKGFGLELWKEAYKEMYQLAESSQKWRHFKDQKSLEEEKIKEIYSFLKLDEVNQIIQKFHKNLYIPQEITNYRVLKKLISEEE